MTTKNIVLTLMLILLGGCAAVQEPEAQKKQLIATASAPEAIGPYSQAIMMGNTLYCSGQIAIDPKTGLLVLGSIEEETRQVLENLGAVLEAAGMSYENVMKATVFLKDLDNYAAVNGVYSEYFNDIKPAREAVEVARLPKDVNVEISFIAAR